MASELIEFPCDYPIKIITEKTDGIERKVLEIVRLHAPDVMPDRVQLMPSRAGNYVSVRVTIVATGEPQLKALHKDLMQLPEVRMVL